MNYSILTAFNRFTVNANTCVLINTLFKKKTAFIGMLSFFILICSPTINAQSSVDDTCQSAIRQFVDLKFDDAKDVLHYYYSDIKINIPDEIQALNNLKESREQLITTSNIAQGTIDSLININDSLTNLLNSYITENQIEQTYALNHLFKINTNDGHFYVMEADFILNNNFQITNIHQRMKASLTNDENDWFVFLVHSQPIYLFKDKARQSKANKDFYTYIFSELSKDRSDKDELLHAVILVVKHIKLNKGMIPAQLVKEAVMAYLTRRFSDEYLPGEFINFVKDDVTGTYQISHSYGIKDEKGNTTEFSTTFLADKFFIISEVQDK